MELEGEKENWLFSKLEHKTNYNKSKMYALQEGESKKGLM
jgi:hypothetical protein